jgi:hypothetical protein
MLQVTLNLDEAQTKELFKQAILEMLQERNEVLYEALAEIMEDIGLIYAIQQGEDSETVDHWKVK